MAESAGSGGNASAGSADGAAPAPESAPPQSAPAESAPAESAPAESAPAESAPAESAPAESAPAESAPAESAPAESGATNDSGAAGSPDNAAGEASAAADPKAADDQGQQPAAGDQPPGSEGQAEEADAARQGGTGSQEAAGDEFGQRVLEQAPLPDSDTGAMRDAAADLRTVGTRGQQAADEALSVSRATGQDFRGQPGEQLGERLATQAQDARATGEDMTRLAGDVDRAADTIDATRQERLADIQDGRPLYAMAGTLPPGEDAVAKDRMVSDAAARGQQVNNQAAQQIQQNTGGWQVTAQHEQTSAPTPSRIEIRAPADEATGRGKEKLLRGVGVGGREDTRPGLGAVGRGERLTPGKSKNYLDPAGVGDASVVRNYDAVRDAIVKVDSGLHNLKTAGGDVPVRFQGSVSGWHSTGLPSESLYAESASSPTEKGARFDEKRAWGAAGAAGGRLDIGGTTAMAGADALAGAEAKARLDLGGDGKYLGAEAGGFLGARAGVNGAVDIGGLGAGAKAELRAGVGLEAGVSFGQKDGKWVVGGKLGAALGIGGKVEGQIVIDPAKAGQTLADAGRAIGDAVGKLFAGQSQAAPMPVPVV